MLSTILTKKLWQHSIWIGCCLILFMTGTWTALARIEDVRLIINQVKTETFPQVTVSLTVLNHNGLPVVGLTEENFQVFEDQAEIEPITVTGDTTQELALILALDVSHEQAGDLVNIKKAAIAFIDTLNPNDSLAVVTFHDEPTELFRGKVSEGEEVKQLIQALEVEGNRTAFYKTAYMAIDILKDNQLFNQPRQAVVILTNIGENIEDEAAGEAKQVVQQGDIPIHILSFGDRAKVDELTALAQQTGGQSFALATAEELLITLQRLAIFLRSGYKITFQPGVKPGGDKERHLSIRVTLPQGQSTQAQASFTTPDRAPVKLFGVKDIYPGESLDLTAEVDVSDPSLISVFYQIDESEKIKVSSPHYAFRWTGDNVATGLYTATVIVVDQAGHQIGMETEPFEVMPPVANIVVPIATAYLGQDFVIEANIEEKASFVSQVEFFLGDEPIGETAISPYRLVFRENHPRYPEQAGQYIFTVKIRDRRGAITGIDRFAVEFVPIPPQPSLLNWYQFFGVMVVIFGFIVLMDILLLIWWLLSRGKKERFEARRLSVRNLGNVPTAYELSVASHALAENGEQSQELIFQLREVLSTNGQILPPLPARPDSQSASSTSPPAAATQPTTAAPVASTSDPAAATTVAPPAGSSSPTTPTQPVASNGRGKQAVGQVGETSQAGLEILDAFSGIPVIGRPFRKWSAAIRQGKGRGQFLLRLPGMFLRPIKLITRRIPGLKKLGSSGPKKTAKQQATESVQTTPAPETEAPPSLPPPSPASPEPSIPEQPVETIQPTLITSGPRLSAWDMQPRLETTVLSPGETWPIDLWIKPVKTPTQNRAYTFQINSRPVGQTEMMMSSVPQKSVQFKPVFWLHRAFPDDWSGGILVFWGFVNIIIIILLFISWIINYL